MRLIDVMHLGRPRVIGCWLLDDVLVDPGPASCLPTLLEALGDERPRALLLTHVHLDHAGASGSLVRRWPELEVYVHERGAAHLVDPERLLRSSRRLYGDALEELWGEVVAVPQRNIRELRGGETLAGGFEVLYTPGHASHHVVYVREGTAFTGDAAGVRIAPGSLTIPPTVPPEVDLEAWHQSIERIRGRSPERLALTHFGESRQVAPQLQELGARLDDWAERVRHQDVDAFAASVRAEVERGAEPGLLDAYTQAGPPELLYAGLRRYWQKREEAVTSPNQRVS